MSVLSEAEELVYGDRNATYGHPLQDFQRVAVIWSGILNQLITPEQVGQCLIGLKLARECYQHQRDHLVDLAGYALTLQMLADEKELPCPPTTVLPAEPCCRQSEATSPAPDATPSPSVAVRDASVTMVEEVCPKCQRFLHPAPHRCD